MIAPTALRAGDVESREDPQLVALYEAKRGGRKQLRVA